MKKVIITGAAGGIGKELAKYYGRLNYNIAITDLQEKKLAEVKQEVQTLTRGKVSTHCFDQADSLQNKNFLEQYTAENGGWDILCLNAGVGFGGSLENTTLSDFQRLMNINFFAVVDLVKLFTDQIIHQGKKNILITSSFAGLAGIPMLSAYSASKFALIGFGESVRFELLKKNIFLTLLCPGIINTEIIDASATSQVSQQSLNQLKDFYKKYGATAADTAAAAAKAVEKGQFLKVHPVSTDLLLQTKKMLPDLFSFFQRWLEQQINPAASS